MQSFNATFGITVGYDNTTKAYIGQDSDALDKVAEAWDAAMEKEFERTGILVSATLTPSRVVYRREYGCPRYGEVTVTVSGLANPKFTFGRKTMSSWQDAVYRIVAAVKDDLQQSRVTLFFQDIEKLIYIEPETLTVANSDSSGTGYSMTTFPVTEP